LAAKEILAPLSNDSIMLGRAIFRHLQHQNKSIISDFIHRGRMRQQFRNGGGTKE